MERIGPYEVHEQLGRGGMGSVFRAVDPRSGQEVALKLLAVVEERSRRRLVLEARALARLRHRNVVSLLDAGEDRGRPWIALELVRGRSLQERLDREGPLAPREAARLVQAVAAGLAHAHREGVLHRDLKPANVLLLEGEGDPKLTDFGLAGFTFDQSQSRLTKSGMFMGSPGYWAPEQAAGQATALGPPTDVYGLGALLYAALTGRPPIEGDSLPAILAATEHQRPERPHKDRVLDAIAMRCLEKTATDRYGSVDEVARELSRYLAGRRARRGGRRARIGGAVVLALVGLAGAGAWVVSARPAASPPPTSGSRESAARVAALALVESAVARAARGDSRGALADLDRAIEHDPGNASAYASRGGLKDRLGDFQSAIADCDRALELAPDHWPAFMNRAGVKASLGDHAGALADIDRAVELEPRDAGALALRGSLKGALADLPGALADLDRAIELDPRRAVAYEDRATIKGQQGDHEGALVDQSRVVALEPNNAQAYVARATTRVLLRDDVGAIADHDRAILLDPGHARAHAYRGAARARRGDDPGAIVDYEEALRLGLSARGAEEVSGWLGEARARLARLAEAAELVDSGAERAKRGDFQGAVDDLDRALALDPRSARGYSLRGAAKANLHDDPGAIADSGRAIELDPSDPTPFVNRATARVNVGDDAGAIADYEAALRLAPDAAWAEEARTLIAAARARLARR